MSNDSSDRRRDLRARHFIPLAGFALPTVVIGYGFVIPGSCIAGVNELTVGFASAIARGRADVRRAEAAHLPFEDARFDAALAVHFWPDPSVELREIHRVLRPGGVLVLGFRPDDRGARASLPDSVYHLRPLPEIEKLLREAGFEKPRAAEKPSGAPFVCVSARAIAHR